MAQQLQLAWPVVKIVVEEQRIRALELAEPHPGQSYEGVEPNLLKPVLDLVMVSQQEVVVRGLEPTRWVYHLE